VNTRETVKRLLEGRAKAAPDLRTHLSDLDGSTLPDKMRRCYLWIVNNAILCPTYDISFGNRRAFRNTSGDTIELTDSMSYSSFILLPMLTLFTCRRALLVGGPGRGKTSSAILMALISGMPLDTVRRSIQRGHPQLTIADLLGIPLPSDMMKAEKLADIEVSWRSWITERVKVIDEYNRIPTKTQSALLSLMAEGYAEMFDQYVYAGRSSWFLTANDDAGGGTFQVIEALKDRIDIVIRAVPFNTGFLETLLERIEKDRCPEEQLPTDIIFSQEELETIYKDVLEVEIPTTVLNQLSFFLGSLDFCRMASTVFELKNKDTLKLSGHSVSGVCDERCPLDKNTHLCTQTENGVSVRVYQTVLHFAKALAYFRGQCQVSIEDVSQILPWVLHDKLVPNARSPFFLGRGRDVLLYDRVAWIRDMFSSALNRYSAHEPARRRVHELRDELNQGLEGLDIKTAESRMAKIASLLDSMLTRNELSGPVYEDIVLLKSIHSRYQNYAQWLRQKSS
jgi:MoxR-like ATPase